MGKAGTLMADFVVFLPLALMVVLYARVVYTLWYKRNDNQLTHQQIVSVNKEALMRRIDKVKQNT